MESRLADLQCRYDELVASSKATVTRLQAEVLSLQQHVRQQADELALLRTCRSGAAGSVSELLQQLRTEHEALLQRQLDDVRSECLRICSSQSDALNSYTVTPAVSCTQSRLSDGDELTVTAGNASTQTEAGHCCTTVAVCPSQVSQKRQLSPSFDLNCTSDSDRLLAKSTKLF